MNNSNNQMKAKMIQSHAITDTEKIAGMERYINTRYPKWTVYPQAWLTFTKGEDEYQYCSRTLTQEEVEEYSTSHPDLYIIKDNGSILIIELDGPIHDIKTEKTSKRNKRYELNRIPYIVISESDLKHDLDIPKSRSLTQKQINTELEKRLKC